MLLSRLNTHSNRNIARIQLEYKLGLCAKLNYLRKQRMKFKQPLLSIITTFALLLSANSQAGRQGINFYYGLGLGLSKVKAVDMMPTADIVFGFEEDGWALEAIAFGSLEAGTDDSSVDTSISGTHIGIAYRTIEKDNSWFKIKVSSTKLDFSDSDGSKDFKTDGTSYTIGYGIRMQHDARLEIDYSYYNGKEKKDPSQNNGLTLKDPVHMIDARYFWGGAPYNGKFTDWNDSNLLYMGGLIGLLESDLGNDYDTSLAYSLIFGVDLSRVTIQGLSIELLLGGSLTADSSLTDPAFNDEYTSSLFGLYGVYRTPGKLYFKASLGYLSLRIEDDLYFANGDFDETIKFTESGLSYGLGAGYKLSNPARLELDIKSAALDVEGFDYDPYVVGLSFLYSF